MNNILEDLEELKRIKLLWKSIVASNDFVKNYDEVKEYLKSSILAWFYEKTKIDKELFEIKLYIEWNEKKKQIEDNLHVYCWYLNTKQDKYQNQINLALGEIQKAISQTGIWSLSLVEEFADFYYSLLKEITT